MKIVRCVLGPFAALSLKSLCVSADQVILDELIVDGSGCIGVDCQNGENFGFDTLRLKQNNLRIHFQDTSTSASFPRTDWRITANDSRNGGQSRFSIDHDRAPAAVGTVAPFTVRTAPQHSLYVAEDGNLGAGTDEPVASLHIKKPNAPSIRLEQDGTGGRTPHAWGIEGNEAAFLVCDVTSSTKPFKIQAGAPDDALCIESGGDIKMTGTFQGSFKSGVVSSGDFSGGGTFAVVFNEAFPDATYVLQLTASATSGSILYSPTAVTKANTGFTIKLASSDLTDLNDVSWIALPAGSG